MRDTEYSDEDLMKSHYYDEEEHRNSLSCQLWRNDHERQIVLDLEAMTKTDEFWGRALASAVLRIWRELSVERQEMQRLLEGLLEIDSCATAIIGSHDTADYAIAVEQAERIGMIVTQITHIAEKATLSESPEMKAVDLTGIERECCGTFHGTPHRSTCENWRGNKTPNADVTGLAPEGDKS